MKVYINGKYLTLPMGEAYAMHFLEYITDNVLYINEADLEKKYQKTKKLFDYVSNSFQMTMGLREEDQENYKFAVAVKAVKQKLSSIDNMQEYCYKQGNIAKAIELMNRIIEEMCSLYDLELEDNKQVRMGR